MKVYNTASIRNVAVVGHGGCGKTQLVSALLFAAGMVNRLGLVDDGTTVTDYDDEEIARKHTLERRPWRTRSGTSPKSTWIDTPGVGNFFADATAALHVAESALVVVDAVAGVEDADREGVASRRRAGAPALDLRATGSIAIAASLERTRGIAPADPTAAAINPDPVANRRGAPPSTASSI